MQREFLPATLGEIKRLGWQQPDIIIISGDAYIDHPSFAAAVIGRWLQNCGYKVAILPQPDYYNPQSFRQLGKPRLFFGITSGNMDSMINKYTARKKLRSEDAYTPNGKTGERPDRAVIVYSQIIHSQYKDVPIVIGGIESSMRRLPHYDYWSDKLRNSVLFDSRADYLVYGMGERAISELAEKLEAQDKKGAEKVRGIALIRKEKPQEAVELPAFHKDFGTNDFGRQQQIYEKHYRTRVICQQFAGRWLQLNPPAQSFSTWEMDKLYDLPFMRAPHPIYAGKKLTAFDQIKNSVTTHRGCFGGCSFCGIGYHQGKTIQSRSQQSIIREIKKISETQGFHGTISDLGGPSANMYAMKCGLDKSESCQRTSCLYPEICPQLKTSHLELRNLLRKAANMPEIKHLFVASGIRFDLALTDQKYIRQISEKHISGLIKLAPEHKSKKVLNLMQKPVFNLYQEFLKFFWQYSQKAGKNQAAVPYIIIGHPGETLQDTIELAMYLKKENVKLRQIQEFIPLPMTASAQMYFTGRDLLGNSIHVPKGREIRLMKALIQWYVPQNRKLILEALNKAGRPDLKRYFLQNMNK